MVHPLEPFTLTEHTSFAQSFPNDVETGYARVGRVQDLLRLTEAKVESNEHQSLSSIILRLFKVCYKVWRV